MRKYLSITTKSEYYNTQIETSYGTVKLTIFSAGVTFTFF